MELSSKTTFLQSRSELSDYELKLHAPSIFATAPMAGVSQKYAFVPTCEVVNRMRDAGWIPVCAQQQRFRLPGRSGFQKHLIRFQRRDLFAIKGDFATEICLVNSHDRSSAFQLHVGLYRFLCDNGLMVADTSFERLRIRHSGFRPDDLVQASFAVLDQTPKIEERVSMFRDRELTPEEITRFATSALALRYEVPERAPISPAKLLTARRPEDHGPDLWRTFNRIQENLLQGGMKDDKCARSNGKAFGRVRAIKGLDRGVEINKPLWQLAEEFVKNN
jgi:hypothetical protein